MLIDFMVNNWLSFADEALLNMVSSRERQHGDTLAELPGFKYRHILPIASIYGGNTAGKTNLIRGLACLRQLVTKDVGVDNLLPITPFKFALFDDAKPTEFDITFLANEKVYRLYVEATQKEICYESLDLLIHNNREENIYERDHSRDDVFVFSDSFFKDLSHVEYAAKSTRENRLFLGSAVDQNINELKDPYQWFAKTLEVVGVSSQANAFASAVIRGDEFLQFAAEALKRFDTGIIELTAQEVSPEIFNNNSKVQQELQNIQDDQLLTIINERNAGDYGFEMYIANKEDGQIAIKRISAIHEGLDGNTYTLLLSQESSGTQRLMGLLPMLYDFSKAELSKVFVVDELDRCFHTKLTQALVEDFLKSCDSGTRKQLIFTTHDLLLMDQDLLRRDEMFITERDIKGRSRIIGLAEYDGLRSDKDIIKSYLDGRFGGLPVIG